MLSFWVFQLQRKEEQIFLVSLASLLCLPSSHSAQAMELHGEGNQDQVNIRSTWSPFRSTSFGNAGGERNPTCRLRTNKQSISRSRLHGLSRKWKQHGRARYFWHILRKSYHVFCKYYKHIFALRRYLKHVNRNFQSLTCEQQASDGQVCCRKTAKVSVVESLNPTLHTDIYMGEQDESQIVFQPNTESPLHRPKKEGKRTPKRHFHHHGTGENKLIPTSSFFWSLAF